MTTNRLNGRALDLPPPGRHGSDPSRHNGDTYRSPSNGDGVVKDTASTRARQLEAAMREIDALVKLNMRLEKKSALLAKSLENARRFAYHDELTGLPNRRLLFDHFKEAVARAKRQHNRVVLLFLDLDDFKVINDSVGHVAADRLLQQVASRLTARIRGSDTACRYGGDELVILLTDIDTRDDAFAATEKIRTELTEPYEIDGTPVRVNVSIGSAAWPDDGKDCLALIKVADTAMYREKRRSAVAQGRPVPTVPAGLEQTGWPRKNLFIG